MNAEQLKEELDWIEQYCDGKPYAVDVVIPQNYVGRDEPDLTEEQLEDKLWSII